MEKVEWQSVIEGLLFVAGDEGLTIKQLVEVLEINEETIKEALHTLQSFYEKERRGLQLIELAETYRIATRPEHADYVKKLAISPLRSTLSQAALEILAIVAYQQPITRVEIEEIRGVRSDRAIRTLMAKLLIEEVGREQGAGRPILYGTTPLFLEHFGFNSLEDLPPLPEKVHDESIEEEADLFLQNINMEVRTE